MKEIRCPKCAGIVCKALNPPIEGRCSSCHTIVMYDGTRELDKARPMNEAEIKEIKSVYHENRRKNKRG